MAGRAPTLKKVFLELGGKSALIVLDDADLAAAVGTAAFAAALHAGQGCALTTRLLVPRDRYDEAVQVAADTMAALGAGDPTDPGTVCGPVISARQRDRVERLPRTWRSEEGGTSPAAAATGRQRTAGSSSSRRSSPASTTRAESRARRSSARCWSCIPHDGDDDAVRIANDSPYGLSGAVDSGSTSSGRGPSPRRIRTGTLGVNGGVWYGADVPFGGYKQSGIGREMGVAGFEEYLETKPSPIRGGMRDAVTSLRRQGRDRHRCGAGHRRGVRRARSPPRARRSWSPTSTSSPAKPSPRRSSPTAARRWSCASTFATPASADGDGGARRSRSSAASTCWSTTPPSTATWSSTC